MLQFSEIERRRALSGIQQKVLAEKAGLTPQAYAKLKRPTKHGPTETTLRRLTEALTALTEERADG